MNLLSIDNLKYQHNRKTLMENLSLTVKKGELVGVLGINGAGKTTLFDLICKMRKPSHGTIINRAERQVYLTQILTPPPLLRMREIFSIISCLNSNHALSQREVFSRLAHWSPSLSKRYADISEKKAATCSYGEIRSFFTLTLLLMGSDLIILDEPTAGVDPEFRHYIWLGIKHACEEGASVLVSSHYTQEISENCHRFYMLAHHRLEAFDNGDQFLNRHNAATLDEAFINAAM
ncbi:MULTISPECIES: ATP-binding cassette domain-containing protein [unclassified Pseudomonas]|jgi:ABC-type multidrug transport system, ATPase component|uniref:ATP-binding cassette domain-containing protein n=1 Tax=unclassified Pseudomonas TaxID=196821 RepID=UPI00040A6D6E|nr:MULTISPECIES: ATP-binding cassette domain-containing protein [unclassified Pseudomonas]MBC3488454.1 ATP-binding cassette domain-containing protein [Pseudomonas sp. SWRI50]SMF04596.1 ABC-2 type transport system ATP-binding protein [Pseudomonas sp. LAIL14HWK12:I11]SMR72588.1 ABC-2 type transport system ATP-binding protein [Pseudomonas sp. LAIL14HWK12:I10]SOD01486.1 ABC-2 type transport system ATP-binding protein [Pseudomonas sp. LAIL14HWK12:I8]